MRRAIGCPDEGLCASGFVSDIARGRTGGIDLGGRRVAPAAV